MTNKKYAVYVHITPSGKKYVGITCQSINQRWRNGNGYKDNQYFYNAIKKYGWENIEHYVVCCGLSAEDASTKEIELIAKYDSTNRLKGYNNSTGGDKGSPGHLLSESKRKEISEKTKEAMHRPEVSKKLGGQFRGKHLSKEHKEKIRVGNLGRKNSEKTRLLLSKANTGKHWTEETRIKLDKKRNIWQNDPVIRKKMSDSHAGKKRSKESIEKQIINSKGINSKNNKAVVGTDRFGNETIYFSISDAKNKTNNTAISYALKNGNISGGYKWRYKDE